jgi:GGDEF domain-containing protein
LISILRTVSELERLEKFQKAAFECYGLALSSTEQNVIEFDETETARFRANLRTLISQLDEATTPEQLRNIQGLFRTELHDYKDATHEQIRRLRGDLDAAASALEEFAINTASSGDNHEKELKQTLNRLDVAAASERLDDIREAIRAASARILASFEQMQAANHLAVAQLKDEIRLLHQTIQSGRRSATSERRPKAWNRRKIDDQIDELLSQDASFCLILVVLRNLKPLASRNSGVVIEDALHSLQARLQGMLGGASVGRWTKNQFVAILKGAPGSAMVMSREVVQKLTEPYDFQDGGVRRTLSFQVVAGVVDHRTGADVVKFRTGLEKLSTALGGAQQ